MSSRITSAGARQSRDGRRQLNYELLSGASGLFLAVFMWGHLILVGSILTGARGFDWLASTLERYYIAQPTVVVILFMFLIHAAFASRKIPSKLRERRRMLEVARALRSSTSGAAQGSPTQGDHVESLLWIWQVRTGAVILVLGSFHLVLLGLDVLTPTFGSATGIESATTLARVRGGLWLPYAVLLLAVEFHASVGLYRLAVKWGVGAHLSRLTLHSIERVIFWLVLGLGAVTLLVLAGVVAPPFEFLLTDAVP